MEIDRSNEAELRAWWEVGQAASAERPIRAWPAWEVSRLALPQPRTDLRLVLTGVQHGDRLVGTGMVVLYLLDNTHVAEINVWVDPENRRRSVGRAVLDDLERVAREDRRTTALSSAFAPLEDESPGSLFAAAMGYAVASAEETKVVNLTTAPAEWSELDREVAAELGKYRIRIFDTVTPDEYVDDFCALLSVFIGETPTGDLDLEDAQWTVERLREGEQRAIKADRTQLVAVAVAPDGHLCGFSDLKVYRADPKHGWVGGTLVLPEHRGHRLGLGMKLMTHRRALEMFPECEYVETGNAGVNAHMNALNDRMGYRVVERCLDVQKRLDGTTRPSRRDRARSVEL